MFFPAEEKEVSERESLVEGPASEFGCDTCIQFLQRKRREEHSRKRENSDHVTVRDWTWVAPRVRKSEKCSSPEGWGARKNSYSTPLKTWSRSFYIQYAARIFRFLQIPIVLLLIMMAQQIASLCIQKLWILRCRLDPPK